MSTTKQQGITVSTRRNDVGYFSPHYVSVVVDTTATASGTTRSKRWCGHQHDTRGEAKRCGQERVDAIGASLAGLATGLARELELRGLGFRQPVRLEPQLPSWAGPRYRTSCATCGQLGGLRAFRPDAEGVAEEHQERHTTRILRHEPGTLNPAHACTVERVAR